MRKIRDVLRLKEVGFSQRQIAGSLACARSTVGDTLSRASASALTCEEAQGLDEAALQARLEGRVGELRGQRPGEVRGPEAPYGLRDRGAGGAAGAADLAV